MPDASSGKVLLDGLLHAPPEYEQETVVHGDALIPAIMLASVAAKVMRDRLMVREAEEYPSYGFERHKGYGTAQHIRAIREFGPAPIHRKTFLSHILNASMPA
jgi:ribonuclease HII